MSKRLEMLEMMTSKKPDDPFVWYARAMELRSLDRKDEALAAFGEVATKFPTYVPTYLMGAQVAAELGRADEARAFAERGIEKARAGGDGHALSELTSFLATI
ncbi:tetratricopeptide repeat protein [Sandaracinus amylolyticus]|uniref:tetratricopeptide repeat protein n=1 Tax=Sandaracinus amylolyticus TaxID=927083 RepID=UPI001F20C3B2|nr:tetratricopeptide repeat protein [Sandaracinus amylolyticus]UJR81278.1 Tetratricopeptide repeat-containing protein [Sandaracinus amylolyticus]